MQPEQQIKEMILYGKILFERGKVTGSAANMSIRCGEEIYITRSGSCFGTLTEEDFACIDRKGKSRNGIQPSKEWPLHWIYYESKPGQNAVIHTHSLYATLWSTIAPEDAKSVVPSITPYLQMRIGNIARIPYAPPGSEKLFSLAKQYMSLADGFLMERHGLLVGGKDMENAFYNTEELEYSCQIAWEMRRA